MEQVTEAVKAETTEKRENRENRKPAVKWLIIGLIVSLAASGIFTACYGIFERRAESRRSFWSSLSHSFPSVGCIYNSP